jgi:ADP-dependent NAD(P)H-hydrate dehydratase / NAD(P)H-hydrate epimerase
LATSTSEIQANRMLSCERLLDLFGATTVLKGSGTIIAGSGEGLPAINTRGNPGMASAGMGDVLSGIIAALMGQGLEPFAAARSAVYIHALCAESYAEDNDQTGLIASDVIDAIPRIIKQLRDAG